MVQIGGQEWIPPPVHLALGLYFERTGGSRTDYVRLREVLQLTEEAFPDSLKDEKTTHTLPLKLDTLKRQIRRHMPLLKLHRKALTVVVEKQPSMAARKKGERRRQKIERLAWQYWYDPVDLISTILSATRLRDKMHFGMAQYVDEPTELWHSAAWGSSFRASSGDVAFSSEGNLILPGDFLTFEADDNVLNSSVTTGRIVFIGRDHRSYAEAQNEICVTLKPVVDWGHHLLRDFEDESAHELIVIEDSDFELSPSQLLRHLDIYIDRNYDDAENESEEPFNDERIYIRRVYNTDSKIIRPIARLHPTRAELEVSHFGRDHVERFFSQPHLSLPYLLFIDGFGVHRNMYRSLKAFYLIPANLSYEERRKVANVFTLTLGPHGAALGDVVEAFSRGIRQLDRGFAIPVNDTETEVCSFVMGLIGDMPQQAENGGFAHHSAQKGCRSCFCPKALRGDLQFDIVQEGRYHFETVRQREHAEQLVGEDRKAFLKETGLQLESPVIARLCPALDLVRTRAYDAPHSEWRGLGRTLHSFFVTTMLSKQGNTQYLRHFQSFQYPPGWPRIQSPTFYMGSWSLSEAGRASILLPLILRCHATVGWFRLSYLQAVDKVMKVETSSLRAVVQALGVIAYSNTLIGSQRYTSPDQLHRVVLRARKAYQDLIRCGMVSGEAFPIPTATAEEDQEVDNPADEDDNEDTEGNPILSAGGANHNHMAEILQAAVDSESDLDFPPLPPPQPTAVPQRKKKGKRGRKPKTDKFENLLNLPNVHSGLHFADNAREFGTVMNSNVLAGELKHMSSASSPHSLPG